MSGFNGKLKALPERQTARFRAVLGTLPRLTATFTPQPILRAQFGQATPIPGPVGPEGPPGPPTTILPSVPDEGYLPETGERGQVVMTEDDGHLWSWNIPEVVGTPANRGKAPTEYQWIDVGYIRGQQGEPGTPGPVGPQGPQSEPGATGPQGPEGAQGPTGPTGATGAQGNSGPTGATGPQGPEGPAGLQGVPGEPGSIGPAGPQGSPGSEGPAGPVGAAGATGATGPQGPQGDPGLSGPEGPQGPAGFSSSAFEYSFNDTVATPPGGGQVRMDNADQHLATHLWLSNMTAPGGDAKIILLGVQEGDNVLIQDKDNSARFEEYIVTGPPVDNSTWVDIPVAWDRGGDPLPVGQRVAVLIQNAGAIGPQGPQGEQGIPGPIGATGATGATGTAGPAGPTGPAGLQGDLGPQGPKGDTGVAGPQGVAGSAGTTGVQGPAGAQGPAGSTGATGPTGPQGTTGAQGATGATGATGLQGNPGPIGATGAQGPQGVPGDPATQTPWAQNIDAANFALNSAFSIGVRGDLGGSISMWSPGDANWRFGMSNNDATVGFARQIATSHVMYTSFASSPGQGFAVGDKVSGLSAFEVTGSGGGYQAYFRGGAQIGGRIYLTGGSGTVYASAPIEIFGVNSRLAFHWPGVASQIGIEGPGSVGGMPVGTIRTFNNPGTGFEHFAAANVYANGSVQATGQVWCTHVHTTADDIGAGSISHIAIQNGDSFIRWCAWAQFAADMDVWAQPQWGRITGKPGLITSGVDGNAGGCIGDWNVSNPSASMAFNYAALEVIGNNTYYARIGFHHPYAIASQIVLEPSGRIAIYNNPGNAYEAFAAGSIQATGNINATGSITAAANVLADKYHYSGGEDRGGSSPEYVMTMQTDRWMRYQSIGNFSAYVTPSWGNIQNGPGATGGFNIGSYYFDHGTADGSLRMHQGGLEICMWNHAGVSPATRRARFRLAESSLQNTYPNDGAAAGALIRGDIYIDSTGVVRCKL